jgi:hypothetical protein
MVLMQRHLHHRRHHQPTHLRQREGHRAAAVPDMRDKWEKWRENTVQLCTTRTKTGIFLEKNNSVSKR